MGNHQDGTPRASVAPAAHNEFADECEVFQNSAKNCAEPKATAYDHHDGELTSKISTTYRLFVESKAMKNPMHVERVAKGISRKTRGEWIIDYNVTDADGNKAETLTFALILVDTQAPNCHKSTISPAADRLAMTQPFVGNAPDPADLLSLKCVPEPKPDEKRIWISTADRLENSSHTG